MSITLQASKGKSNTLIIWNTLRHENIFHIHNPIKTGVRITFTGKFRENYLDFIVIMLRSSIKSLWIAISRPVIEPRLICSPWRVWMISLSDGTHRKAWYCWVNTWWIREEACWKSRTNLSTETDLGNIKWWSRRRVGCSFWLPFVTLWWFTSIRLHVKFL